MIGGYFTLLLGVAWWVVTRSKNTAADYFLAGRNLSWWIVGASIFASNIGSEHVVGLAGSGAKDGVAMAHYELHAWCLLMLAWVFVPFYARSMVFTMPEFLEKRFSVGSRYVLSIVSLITFVVSKIAVGIFAGGVVFSTLLPEMHLILPGGLDLDSFWIGSVLVIVLTGLYTVLGGMRAVAYNDAMQTIVLICGSATLTIYGLWKLGSGSLLHGWTQLHATCRTQDMFNLWKPLLPEGVEGTWAPVLETSDGHVVREAWYFNDHFPWLGMAICAPVIGLWYWCTDQYIVQRALGAPNEKTARRGSIFAAVLKLFPVYLFIVPGLICYALSKNYIEPKLTGATTFEAADFKYKEKEFLTLAAKLSQPQDEASRFVAVKLAELSPDAYKQLAGVNDPKNSYADLRGELAKGFNTLISCTDLRTASVDELNKIIEAGSIDDKRRFPEAMLSEETKRLRGARPRTWRMRPGNKRNSLPS